MILPLQIAQDKVRDWKKLIYKENLTFINLNPLMYMKKSAQILGRCFLLSFFLFSLFLNLKKRSQGADVDYNPVPKLPI